MAPSVDFRTREPGLAAALAADLDPDEFVHCYAVRWLADDRWHRVLFAVADDASAYALTIAGPYTSSRYVTGTVAMRRDVHPPMVTS